MLYWGAIRGVLDPLERRPREVAIAFVPEVHVMVLMIVHQFCIDKLRPFQAPRPPIPLYPLLNGLIMQTRCFLHTGIPPPIVHLKPEE